MSARLNPRLGWVLLAVLSLCVFLAVQPSSDEDLAAPGRDRSAGPEASGRGAPPSSATPSAAAVSGRRGAAEAAARAASTPSPAQARDLAGWANAWDRRASAPWASIGTDARWSWAAQQPPTPPPPVQQEAPPPMAPPFPYAWVGRFVDNAPRAVIVGPNRTWVLLQGEVIEGQWRVGAMAERQLTMTYLPLNQDQSVALK